MHNLEGKRFGKLLAVRPTQERRRSSIMWECVCDCGVTKNAPSHDLVRGNIVSCGCHGRSILGNITRTHGKSLTPEHIIWKLMRQRCANPNTERFNRYGGRGIKVCSRWDDFAAFLSDMGPRPSPEHSIERINTNGDYEPKNCRWATRIEQANNTCANRIIIHHGETKTLTQWARSVGLKEGTLRYRLKRGWDVDKSLTTPLRRAISA